MDEKLEAAFRALARAATQPLSVIAYGLVLPPESEKDVRRKLEELLREDFSLDEAAIVVDPDSEHASAKKRTLFKRQVLAQVSLLGKGKGRGDASRLTGRGTPEKARENLDSLSAQLPTLLDDVDRTLSARLSEKASEEAEGTAEASAEENPPAPLSIPESSAVRRSDKKALPLVLVRRLEDLGGSAESVADALRALLTRGAHVAVPSDEIDTRSREGRLVTRAFLRAGMLKASSARTRSMQDLERRRAQLRVYGPVPYGFTKEGQELREHDDQLAVVKRVRDLARMGQKPLAIAIILNREKRTWKDGSSWTQPRVSQILKNPIYNQVLEKAKA